jgi:hypothetical protein
MKAKEKNLSQGKEGGLSIDPVDRARSQPPVEAGSIHFMETPVGCC